MMEGQPKLKTVSIRLPIEVIERMEKLQTRIQAAPEYAGAVNITTAAVIRMALIKGMDTLEKDYPIDDR